MGARRRPRGLPLGVGLLAIVLIGILLGPIVTPYDPTQANVLERLMPPSSTHLLGTDQLGRDLLARVLYGGRVSLWAVAVILALSLLGGVPVGLAAGYFGGRVDRWLSALMDVVLAVPQLVLVLFVAGVSGPGLMKLCLTYAMVHWVSYARILRAAVLSEREREYVQAALAAGASSFRILARHIGPNITGPLIVWTTLDAGKVILGIAGLSFLGLGAQPPTPEWGAMLAGSRSYFQLAPHLMLFPGVAIILTALAINLVGDGLRDSLDPANRLERFDGK
jgi:peptide/nickel transport system permease protein